MVKKMDKKTSSIQVIDRMTKLLDAISTYDDSASLKCLSADTELHPSTAYRILASLIENDFVTRNDAGDYQLGRKLLELGGQVNVRQDLRQKAQQIMKNLRDEIAETVNLTVREGDQIVYIERAIPNRMMRVEQVIGSRAPLHVTAVGKLMLAVSGEKAIEDYAQQTGLPGFTKNTLTTLKDLKVELKTILQQNYSFDNEEAELGVGCIGTLIYNSVGKVVAGLSISAPIERRRKDWIPKLTSAAEKISAHLGYQK